MMDCRDCEKFLEEYLDGELDAHAARSVEAHLARCEACASAHESLAAEQNFYTAYERGLEVTPRLWDGVAARIREERSVGEVGLLRKLSTWIAPLLTVPRFSPALTAALVLVAIALTVGVMKLTGSHAQPQKGDGDIARNDTVNINRNPSPAPTTPQPTETTQPGANETPTAAPSSSPESQPSPENRKSPAKERRRMNDMLGGGQVLTASNTTGAPAKVEQTPDQLVREAEQRYIAAINILQRDVAAKRSKLDPQTVQRFDQSLAAIDRSISETRRAVAQHASDPVAVQYMLSAYAKKVEVLREMAHADQ